MCMLRIYQAVCMLSVVCSLCVCVHSSPSSHLSYSGLGRRAQDETVLQDALACIVSIGPRFTGGGVVLGPRKGFICETGGIQHRCVLVFCHLSCLHHDTHTTAHNLSKPCMVLTARKDSHLEGHMLQYQPPAYPWQMHLFDLLSGWLRCFQQCMEGPGRAWSCR